MQKKGFTLVELLVVLAILVTIGSIISAILYSAFRGSGKATTTEIVRQNGDYAMTQMTKLIKNSAWNLVYNSGDGVSADGKTYTTICVLPTGTPTPTPSVYHYLRVTSLRDNQQTTFLCDSTADVAPSIRVVPTPAPGVPIASISAYGQSGQVVYQLADPKAVNVISCQFVCSTPIAGTNPTITITATLQPATATNSNLLEALTGPITFNTTIEMNKINQ